MIWETHSNQQNTTSRLGSLRRMSIYGLGSPDRQPTYIDRRLHATWHTRAFEDDGKSSRRVTNRPGEIPKGLGKCSRVCQLFLDVGGGESLNSQSDLSETVFQGKVDTTLVNITDGYFRTALEACYSCAKQSNGTGSNNETSRF